VQARPRERVDGPPIGVAAPAPAWLSARPRPGHVRELGSGVEEAMGGLCCHSRSGDIALVLKRPEGWP
jgi:hypothetical protein